MFPSINISTAAILFRPLIKGLRVTDTKGMWKIISYHVSAGRITRDALAGVQISLLYAIRREEAQAPIQSSYT